MPTIANLDTPTFEEYAVVAWPSLYRQAYLLSGNHADAEDLAQQTLIKTHGAWSRVSGAESPNTYVRRILTNTFLSAKRPKGRRLELLAGENAPEPIGPPVVGPEDRMALWPHVRALPPRQRAVVVLRYYEQLSEAEIADALGCSRGNVKSTAHRALQNLRTALDGREV
jgi:RNA polymerase sigma-70 factor (sigma-E family)